MLPESQLILQKKKTKKEVYVYKYISKGSFFKEKLPFRGVHSNFFEVH